MTTIDDRLESLLSADLSMILIKRYYDFRLNWDGYEARLGRDHYDYVEGIDSARGATPQLALKALIEAVEKAKG